jgi:hypothetical protein
MVPTVFDHGAELDLITDEALAASMAASPITDVAITLVSMSGEKTSLGQAEVTATYSHGGIPGSINAYFYGTLDSSGDMRWELSNFFFAELAPDSAFGGIAVNINGVPAPRDTDIVLPLPGTYEATSADPNVVFETGQFTMVDNHTLPSVGDFGPVLSDVGLTAVRAAVRDALDECLTATTFDAGCGLSIENPLSDGTEVVEGTVTRIMTRGLDDELDAMTPRLDANLFSANRLATMYSFTNGIDLEVTAIVDGVQERIGVVECLFVCGPFTSSGAVMPAMAIVDLSSPDLAVTWR